MTRRARRVQSIKPIRLFSVTFVPLVVNAFLRVFATSLKPMNRGLTFIPLPRRPDRWGRIALSCGAHEKPR